MVKSSASEIKNSLSVEVIDFVCPSCNSGLTENISPKGLKEFECLKCQISFPTLGNEIPILFGLDDDPDAVLNDDAVSLLRSIVNLENKLKKTNEELQPGSPAPAFPALLTQAYSKNLNFLNHLLGLLEPHIDFKNTIKSILKQDTPSTSTYGEILEYLIRDWSFFEESEVEISTITRHCTKLLQGCGTKDRELSLFLGAGCGRLAFEQAPGFERTIALDLAIGMGAAHLLAKAGKSSVCEIHETNILSRQDAIRHYTPKFPKSAEKNNLTYCLASALNTPLKDKSVSVIFSIFFTDVVPFPYLLREVARLLKPNGTFIHFGPLHYHNSGRSNSFALDEIVAEFRAQGFEVILGPEVRADHCTSSKTLVGRYFRSQTFSARKMGLSATSVLELAPKEEVPLEELGAEIAKAISLVDGKKNLSEILAHFPQKNKTLITEQLKELVYDRVLRLK